jgi:hypothetical protein
MQDLSHDATGSATSVVRALSAAAALSATGDTTQQVAALAAELTEIRHDVEAAEQAVSEIAASLRQRHHPTVSATRAAPTADDVPPTVTVSTARAAASAAAPTAENAAAQQPWTDSTMGPTCHSHLNTGFSGDRAVVWGMTFKVASAAECCAACQAHAAACSKKNAGGTHWWPARPEMTCGGNPACNIWTFCPEEQCFAFDIHKHLKGECWLKQQLVNVTHPKDPHEGHKTYPSIMRKAPRNRWPWAVAESVWPGDMPRMVPWTSGVLADVGANIVSAPADDKWRHRWCAKHGPCTD